MGNQLAAHSSNHKQIDELQNACVEAPLGGGRLLQTMLYKHDVGKLVVKVYNKQGESLDLKPYKQQLKNIHDRLKCLTRPHVWPFQEFVETENTGFMIRPFIFQNLYDRICSRPFLSYIEKCWITYQLLEALVQCHSLGVCHGDIKSENVLVTSWNWVFLADFASYKPTYLPVDNPADFSYFFDLTGERRCHVAPERFVDESELKTKPHGGLTPAMDVFSLGCVIAELFLDDGRGMFIFSELHRYKKGQFDPKEKLTKLDPHVQELILHMIQLDPSLRLTSSEYLTRFTPSIFPLYFSKTLAPFFGSLLFEDSDTKLALLKSQLKALMEQIQNPSTDENFVFECEAENPTMQKKLSTALSARDVVYNPENNSGCPYVASDSCGMELMERIEELQKNLAAAMKQFSEIDVHAALPRNNSSPIRMPPPVEWAQLSEESISASNIPESTQCPVESERPSDGMLLLVVLLCSLVRCPKLIESKRTAITLLAEISESVTPECRLNRLVPYFLAMLSDSTASMRALSLHFLLKMLSSIRCSSIQTYERRLYQDYILPSLSLLPNDPEELIRVEYAAGVPELTACACDYLQKEIKSQMGDGSGAQQKHERDLTTLRELIVKVIHELISGERSSSATRSALSTSVSKLAQFYGNKKTPDLLLLLTTFMNDANSEVKVSFFECVRSIDAKSLGKSLKILQPFLETGLKDKDDTVLAAAVSLATNVCVKVNRKKEFVLSMARLVAPMATHRSSAVRARVIEFLAAVAQVLTPADAFARLLPLMKGTLPQDPCILDSEEIIADALQLRECKPISTAPSHSSTSKNANAQKAGLTQRGAGTECLFPKTASYSTHVSLRLIQCGFSRHRASLEEVSNRDECTKRLNSSRERDIRSRSALMTHELSRFSVKHGNLDDSGSHSFSQSNSHPQYRAAINDALSTGMDARSVARTMDAWKPEGILLAHYVEHRRCVNQIAINKDHSNPFFVTASNDGTVKVWDLKHIEDDFSFRSCATYAAQKGEILSVSACEDRRSIASASSHGTIHVWRVNYAPQSRNGSTVDQLTGISARQEISPEEGAILRVQQWDALLLYTSQRGIIHAWDIRMKNDAWKICVDPKEGLIRHVAADPLNGGTWIVTGSSQGVLNLWDVRFKLNVAQWTHPTKNAIVALAPACGPQDQMRNMGIKSQGPFIYVAAGGNEVGLWDIQEQRCKQVFRAISREETEVKKMELPAALGRLSESRREEDTSGATAGSDYCIHRLNRSPSAPEGIRTVLPISEGCIVTGGYDKYIRVWDGVDPKHSFPMCGPAPQNPYLASQGTGGFYDFQYSRHFEHGVPIIDECCLPSHFQRSAQNSLTSSQNSSHVDCITDLGMAHVHEKVLISSGRDGIVKIWK